MTQELLGRVHRELIDVLNSINQDEIHHDGDDFHELLSDVEKALAQPEQELVAWATREDFYRELDRSVNRMRQQMEIKKVVMRCSDYDIALPVIDIREGHVLVGQVTTPPQRKPLTDEEIGKILERGDIAERDAENGRWHVLPYSFARAIEQAHGIKENT